MADAKGGRAIGTIRHHWNTLVMHQWKREGERKESLLPCVHFDHIHYSEKGKEKNGGGGEKGRGRKERRSLTEDINFVFLNYEPKFYHVRWCLQKHNHK